jgi:hypothetical protein
LLPQLLRWYLVVVVAVTEVAPLVRLVQRVLAGLGVTTF